MHCLDFTIRPVWTVLPKGAGFIQFCSQKCFSRQIFDLAKAESRFEIHTRLSYTGFGFHFLSYNPGRIFVFALSQVHSTCGHSILTLAVLCAVMENCGRAEKRACCEEQFRVLFSASCAGSLPALCSADQARQKIDSGWCGRCQDPRPHVWS